MSTMCGGYAAACTRLCEFLEHKLERYAIGKANDPSRPCTSMLSPYLHFGHISPLHVALAVRAAVAAAAAAAVAAPEAAAAAVANSGAAGGACCDRNGGRAVESSSNHHRSSGGSTSCY